MVNTALGETSSTDYLITLNSRLRLLEERYQQLRDNIELLNQNMIGSYRKITKETRMINDDIKDIKKDMLTIKEVLEKIIKEASLFARKDSLKILEKYINMWNPLNFVTEKEVEKIIKEQLKKQGDKNTRKSIK